MRRPAHLGPLPARFAAKNDSSNASAPNASSAPSADGNLHADLAHALTLLQLQQSLIEGQQAQIQKLRIDLAHARESKALLLTVLDDIGALRKMLASAP